MFLIRTAFWLTIVVLLLPTNAREQTDLFGVVKAASADLGGFCTRNPETCEQSKQAFSRFGEKAEFGAKMLIGFFRKQGVQANNSLSENISRSSSGLPLSQHFNSSASNTNNFRQSSSNTLTNDDLMPSWSFSEDKAGA